VVKKKAEITEETTGEMFGDILDRLSGRHVEEPEIQARTKPKPRPQQGTTKSKPIKVSLYLPTEDINALDQVIIKRRKETGKSPRRTHLIQEAIHSWLEQQS